MTIYNISQFGAIGDGISDDSDAIQKAIDACEKKNGGRVLIPAGKTFLTGPVFLKSNLEFYIESGAKLLANPDESVYTKSAFRDNKGEGTIWIGGENLENVTISGGGMIDGNGKSFMGKELSDAFELKPFDIVDPRPHLLTLIGCENVKIRDVSFYDSAYWGLHFVGCNNVSVLGVSIYNNLKVRNSDGIDIDHSQNVNIANCHIESGDDCICFKNRREYDDYGPCKDITITNCTMTSTSCAVKFGSENVDEIKNVILNNCIIKDSNRGIGIQNRDEGTISNILISNIILECRLFSDVWWGKAEPIYITAFPRDTVDHKDAGYRLPHGVKKGNVGKVSNISFSNIQCKSENGIFVASNDIENIENIQFNNVDLYIEKTTSYQGGVYDCRPCYGPDFIEGETAGFYIQKAKDVQIMDCGFEWGENRPEYFTKCLVTKNAENVLVEEKDFKFKSRKSILQSLES